MNLLQSFPTVPPILLFPPRLCREHIPNIAQSLWLVNCWLCCRTRICARLARPCSDYISILCRPSWVRQESLPVHWWPPCAVTLGPNKTSLEWPLFILLCWLVYDLYMDKVGWTGYTKNGWNLRVSSPYIIATAIRQLEDDPWDRKPWKLLGQ